MNKKHYDKSRIIVEEREELYILVSLLALFFSCFWNKGPTFLFCTELLKLYSQPCMQEWILTDKIHRLIQFSSKEVLSQKLQRILSEVVQDGITFLWSLGTLWMNVQLWPRSKRGHNMGKCQGTSPFVVRRHVPASLPSVSPPTIRTLIPTDSSWRPVALPLFHKYVLVTNHCMVDRRVTVLVLVAFTDQYHRM